MATEANLNPDDEKDKEDQPSTSGMVESQASGGSEGGARSPSTPGHQGTPSGAPNIQSYLKANQGAGQQLAQGITGNVQKQANQFGQQVESASNRLNTQANPLQQNLGAGGQNLIKTSFQNPQDILNKQDQLSQFQKLRDQGYKGDISNLQSQGQTASNQLQNQLGNFNQAAQNAGTESGRFQLLRNTLGRPSYSQGQQNLDQLFLQAQPGAGRQLNQNLQGINKQAGQQLTGAQGNFQNTLNGLNTQSAQNASDIQNLIKTGQYGGQNLGLGTNDITQNVGNEYQQAASNAANVQGGLTNAFNTKKFTPEQLAQLGIMPGTKAWGLTGQELMNAGQYAANPLAAAEQGGNAQVATPEEFSRYNALNQLAGNTAGAGLFGSATKAGGYNPISFNNQALQQAIANKQNTITGADFQNAIGGTLANFNMSLPTGPSGGAIGGTGTNPLGLLFQGGGAGSAPGSAPTGGVGVPIAQQLQQAMASGKMTPEQAQEIISGGIKNLQGQYGLEDAYWNKPFQPFLNYYNTEYAPANADILGQNSPDANPLPPNMNGIRAPQGK